MACDVPQKFDGALSLAITPNSAIGPYDENPNAAPRVNIHSWVEGKTGIYSHLKEQLFEKRRGCWGVGGWVGSREGGVASRKGHKQTARHHIVLTQ